jgi:hypothetical protein
MPVVKKVEVDDEGSENSEGDEGEEDKLKKEDIIVADEQVQKCPLCQKGISFAEVLGHYATHPGLRLIHFLLLFLLLCTLFLGHINFIREF